MDWRFHAPRVRTHRCQSPPPVELPPVAAPRAAPAAAFARGDAVRSLEEMLRGCESPKKKQNKVDTANTVGKTWEEHAWGRGVGKIMEDFYQLLSFAILLTTN